MQYVSCICKLFSIVIKSGIVTKELTIGVINPIYKIKELV